MRKVVANLVFSHGYDNSKGTFYKVRLFYVVTKDSNIITLINYGDSCGLAYEYENVKDMIDSMNKVLKNNNFYTNNVKIGSFVFDGIICSEIDIDSVISSPTRFSAK